MKYCWKIIFSSGYSILFYGATGLITNFLSIAVAFYVITLLSKYLSSSVTETLITLSVGVVLFILIDIFVRRLRYNYMTSQIQGHSDDLYGRLINSFAKAEWEKLDQFLSINHFSIQNYQEAFNKTYNPNNIISLIDMFFGIFIYILIYILNFQIAICVGIIALCVFIFPQLTSRISKTIPNTFVLNSKKKYKEPYFLENHSQDFRLLINKQKFLNKFNAQFISLNKLAKRKNKIIEGSTLTSNTLTSLNTVLIFAIGAFLASRGALDVSTLIGISILSARILFCVQRVNSFFLSLQENRYVFTCMESIVNLPKENDGKLIPPFDGFLEVRNMSFIYPNSQRPLIKNLNFKVGPGEVLVITGNNGSGKTTLCQILLGLRNPVSGSVLISDNDMGNLNIVWYRNNICYLPQNPTLIPGTILDNIVPEMDTDKDSDMLHDAIKSCDLQDYFESNKIGISPTDYQSIEHISEGVKKRIVLARALLSHGQYVIFDEPTEGIDEKGKQNLYLILNILKESGRTVIITSKDPYILKAANLVFDLDKQVVNQLNTDQNLKNHSIKINGRIKEARNYFNKYDNTIYEFGKRKQKLKRSDCIGLGTLFLTLVPTISWLMLGTLDISINLLGDLKPSSQIKKIQHFEGGFIKSIHVKEGQKISAGQLLVTLDPIQRGADVTELASRLASLKLIKVRLRAESKLQSPEFLENYSSKQAQLVNQEMQHFIARRSLLRTQQKATKKIILQKKLMIEGITSRIKNATESLQLIDEQIKISADLLDEKIISRYEHIELLRDKSSLKSRIEEDRSAVKTATARYDESLVNLTMISRSFVEDAQRKLKEKSEEFSELSERLLKLEDSFNRTRLVSPVSGIVKKLYNFTIGGTVSPGATVVEIVPVNDRLIIEAKLLPKDISYISENTPVLARLTNVDAFRYPALKGKIIHVSADTISEADGKVFYLVRISLNDNKFLSGERQIKLHPGMILNISIVTGHRSVYEYIFDPLITDKHLALSER
ncbi:MAG: HlyD family type I secretion periplasmic adaptor subunit [Flavobacteriales bacterium]